MHASIADAHSVRPRSTPSRPAAILARTVGQQHVDLDQAGVRRRGTAGDRAVGARAHDGPTSSGSRRPDDPEPGTFRGYLGRPGVLGQLARADLRRSSTSRARSSSRTWRARCSVCSQARGLGDRQRSAATCRVEDLQAAPGAPCQLRRRDDRCRGPTRRRVTTTRNRAPGALPSKAARRSRPASWLAPLRLISPVPSGPRRSLRLHPMEAATPLHRSRVSLTGDRPDHRRPRGARRDGRAARARARRGGGDAAAVVTDAIEIGARVLDREQTGRQRRVRKTEFEKVSHEVEAQFGDRARGVGRAAREEARRGLRPRRAATSRSRSTSCSPTAARRRCRTA